MLSKIFFQGKFGKRKAKQRSSRRSLCVVEPEVSHNTSKIMFEYSKIYLHTLKKLESVS